MADNSLREPNLIRADCARKLKRIETGDTFTAILAALHDEAGGILQLHVIPPTGEMTHKLFIGGEADLFQNDHGVVEIAGLDGDELGYGP